MLSRIFMITAVVVSGVAGPLPAQVYKGAVWGRVTDSTGGVLPGVTVTFSSNRLIAPDMSVTSANGTYRFAELPIGTYELKFQLDGFRPLVRKDIILSAGATVPVLVTLELSSITESVTVSGESPTMDVRQTGTPESFDEERLESLPTARDPWVVAKQAPGVLTAVENVGGNESGNQYSLVSRGAFPSQNTWTYDGVDITDVQIGSGASLTYYDFGVIQEVNVTTSGQSPRLQTPGNSVNILVKQATSIFRGQGAFYGTDNKLQATNIDDDLRAQGAGAGAPTKYILSYNLEGGGPLIADKAWIWGGFGVQDIHRGVIGFLKPGCDDPDDVSCLHDEAVRLSHINAKINYKVSKNNTFSFLFSRNEKKFANRGAGVRNPTPETTTRQSGPGYLYKFEDTHVVSPSFLLTGRFAYHDVAVRFDYQDPSLRQVQPSLELTTGVLGRSISDRQFEAPQYIGNFDGNFFTANKLGGDHEIQFGFQFKRGSLKRFDTVGGDVLAGFVRDHPSRGIFVRPGAQSFSVRYAAAFVQDIYTRGRLSLKIGARFDSQTGKNQPAEIPANSLIPDLMPAVDFPGSESFPSWKNLSPRLGLTYDLTGDGKTYARAGYSRYYSRLEREWVTFNNASGTSELHLPWFDANDDHFVQANEVDTRRILSFSNYNPQEPDALTSPNVIDPEISAPATDELILGVEREVIPDFALGAHFIFRRSTHMVWEDWAHAGIGIPYVGVDASDFVPATVEFEGQELTYYELPFMRPAEEILKNWPDYRQRYRALELTGRKRLSNRWMLNFGLTWGDLLEYFDSETAIFDPTNVELRRGNAIASGGSFSQGMDSRWNFKLNGMVELPAGFHLAGTLNARQGFIFQKVYWVQQRSGGIGSGRVFLQPLGDSRLEDLSLVDFRLDKTFDIGRSRLSAIMDVFNLLNSATVLAREPRQNVSSANRVFDILSPRVIRFGVRWIF